MCQRRGDPRQPSGGKGCSERGTGEMGDVPLGPLLTATGWLRRAQAGRAGWQQHCGNPWLGLGPRSWGRDRGRSRSALPPPFIAAGSSVLPPRGEEQRRFRCHSQRVRAVESGGMEGDKVVISCDRPQNSAWEVTARRWGLAGHRARVPLLSCEPQRCPSAASPSPPLASGSQSRFTSLLSPAELVPETACQDGRGRRSETGRSSRHGLRAIAAFPPLFS